jgi:hypothetical protein
MKDKLYIFGDSFSVGNNMSWVSMLTSNFDVINFSSNGSSEYRILKTYQQHRDTIGTDRLLFCHTAPSRIYLKNNITSLSRLLPSHPWCDLILSDIYSKKEQKFIDTVESIWDEQFFNDIFKLIFNATQVSRSFHITFFDSTDCTSLYNIWKSHPGNINHLSQEGNILAYNLIKDLIK